MEDLQRFLNYKDLFSKCYLENNSIESEEITKNELDILEDLDPDEVFDNLKDLIHSLLYFKRQIKCPETTALETIHSHTENSRSEDDQTQILIEENKKLKLINEEIFAKNEKLAKSLAKVTARALELEKLSKEKTVKKFTEKGVKRGNSNENVTKDKRFITPQKRVTSAANIDPGQKLKVIKSVKFEYFRSALNSQKKAPFKSNKKYLVDSPNRSKISHIRSTSNIFENAKSKPS